MRAILGPEADRVIDSGDRYADRELHQRFVALYDEKHTIDQKNPGRAELDVGPNDWPLPIPLVENNGRWTFDTKAGAQTIVDRRIGRNELSAIRTLLACVDAQHDYFDRAKQATGSGSLCHAPAQRAWPPRRPLLARGRGRDRKPAGAADRCCAGRGLSRRIGRRQADPLRGLLFPHPQGPRSERGWWRQELHPVRPYGPAASRWSPGRRCSGPVGS